ncbi:LANO_0H00958g1_1 [Lachancea nothofagi CBS 11611]|uniref:LANO_0H00958g1_1 n=1 Tax=Lachancea nothofagi CBS 11611 TaxID=1266666 RepID=A0A1G4KKQ6_9SACH|nr:LANO_0H00958g1_1 [Lachancea nothofagi CBS 11611]
MLVDNLLVKFTLLSSRQHGFPRLSRLLLSTSSWQSPEQWLEKLSVKSLPSKAFSFQFDRSSGPGGQKVNKCNSKCTMTIYGFSKCSWIPQEVRNQLMEKNSRFWAKSKDCIVIQSDQTRSRETNRELCLEKLVNEFRSICWFAKPVSSDDILKWDTVRRKSHEERLKDKKFNSDRKRQRQNTNWS